MGWKKISYDGLLDQNMGKTRVYCELGLLEILMDVVFGKVSRQVGIYLCAIFVIW